MTTHHIPVVKAPSDQSVVSGYRVYCALCRAWWFPPTPGILADAVNAAMVHETTRGWPVGVIAA
jgi:hypothetical protein